MTIHPLNPAMAATEPPPVMEARRWLDGVTFPPDRPLINVSQAAPTAPPPLALRQAIADAALNDDAAHLYGPVLGLPALRAELRRNGRWPMAGRSNPRRSPSPKAATRRSRRSWRPLPARGMR